LKEARVHPPGLSPRQILGSLPPLSNQAASRLPCYALAAKQEAKMNWVKCTNMNKQPIYVNIENATSIRWDEKEKSSIIAFAVTGGDTIEVIEEPDAIIRGQ
jgi:hypothetical protein